MKLGNYLMRRNGLIFFSSASPLFSCIEDKRFASSYPFFCIINAKGGLSLPAIDNP
jgi:hypothetical protein